MSESAVGAVTAAPKQAFRWASGHVWAFLVLALVLMIVFVAIETRKPGRIAEKVGWIPVLGNLALNRKTS